MLDATTGQNAHAQVKTFSEMADVTGLALTKLDGTAKGGVIVALARDYDVPVRLVGVGFEFGNHHDVLALIVLVCDGRAVE